MRAKLLGSISLFVIVAVLTLYAIFAPPSQADIGAPSVDGPIGDLIHKLVLDAIPHEYENTKKWGGTKRVWDGVKFETDGLRIKTKRRWKDARHGTWKRYKVWLINPEKEFDIQLDNVRQTDSGKVAYDLTLDAHIGAFGRLSEYRRDVQLVSLSADAEAIVRMKLGCELSAEFGFDKNASPQVTMKPVVTDADLELVDFELHRVSQVGGDVAEELGEGLHKLLQKEINERRSKIVEKANRAITKNEDDLQISFKDVVSSGWGKVVNGLNRD